MNYLELLEHSYRTEILLACNAPESRLEYLAENIFGFTTYDTGMSELFATFAVEVCDAITERATFDYIEDPDKYRWYLLMCQMPFFASKLNWGTSIRGAWWDDAVTIHSYGLWDGDDQMTQPTHLAGEEWVEFIRAVSKFSKIVDTNPES